MGDYALPKLKELTDACVTDREQLFKKSGGRMSKRLTSGFAPNDKKQAPSGPSSPEMVNDWNNGGQQPVNSMMNSQQWPSFGNRQFDQPGYGYQPGYWPHQPMTWNRPIYGQSAFYQPPMPYMWGKK